MLLPVAVLLALACLPFFLLPTTLAFLDGKRTRWLVALCNLLPLAGFAMHLIGAAGALIAWLVVLHFALRPTPPTAADLDEDIELLPYDPHWPGSFAAERARLVAGLGLSREAIEHIGSTAVPGLAAKPVVDMMLGVPALPPTRDLLSRLGILGYQNLGEADVPGRWYLRLRGEQAVNLHVVERGGTHWTNNLALRELLRRDPDARERYARGKQAALETGGPRLLAYSAAKAPVVNELLAAAQAR